MPAALSALFLRYQIRKRNTIKPKFKHWKYGVTLFSKMKHQKPCKQNVKDDEEEELKRSSATKEAEENKCMKMKWHDNSRILFTDKLLLGEHNDTPPHFRINEES
ncbi:hypothetical protein Tcan_01164, partial [Toxocara canis]